ncbi:MAG TPA: prepilin-type N-terminal cleavage/methylation domain-containing protein [Chthonomonadaceae bacterium]|nr:prepilin-type N-terminal cleavage/methylation domain-containing protein [Chthonomonadaceae bacterium]
MRATQTAAFPISDIRPRRVARTLRGGFTLLELLVVMAITAILLGLIFGPVIQSFNLTSRARTQVESQAAARSAMSQVTRLLSNAVFVYDNGQTPLNLWFNDLAGSQKDTGDPDYIRDQIYIPSMFTMVEYVTPARQLDQHPGNLPIDPTTGEPIYGPAVPASQSGFALPLAPGRAVGRIWIGLLDNATQPHTPVDGQTQQNGMPMHPYANRFEDPRRSQDNRYALFHADVVAYVPDPDVAPDQRANAPYVPDLRLFHTVDANGNLVDTKDGRLVLHDPNFFYDNSLAGGKSSGAGDPAKWAVPGWRDLNGDGKVQIAENWRAVATVIVPVDKLDMIALDRDPNTNQVLYFKNGVQTTDADGQPMVRPLATFSPTFLQNDPGVPTALENTANESPSPAPTTYLSSESHWAEPYRVFVYRSQSDFGDPLALNPLDYYEYVPTPDGKGKIVHVSLAPGDTPPDPATLPDVGPNNGFVGNNKALFAFTVDPQRGIINFAFPSSVAANGYPTDVAPGAQRYSPDAINAAITGPYEKRYLDLRTMPRDTWNGLPLNPNGSESVLDQYRTNVGAPALVRIVPGSERVYGPDQRPGPHYGYRTLYTRVSANAGAIGPNEYKINYEDVRNAQAADPNDPRVRIGYIEFDSTWDTSAGPNSGMGPHSLPVAKYNPQTGQIDPNLPADPVEVYYDFQMNRPNDVVKVDYLTRTMMNIVLEARLFDPASSRPQITALTNRIKVRNLQR